MTTATKKPAQESLETRMANLQTQLTEAQQAEATALEQWEKLAGQAILSEATDQDVATASSALEAAQRNTASLRSAIALLTQRQEAASAAEQAEQVGRLRTESADAAGKQATALDQVAQLTGQLTKAVEVLRAQAAVMAGIHAQLRASDPERAEQIAQDYRDDLAEIGQRASNRRAAISEAASQARYRLQDDGTDRLTIEDIPLLDDAIPKGVRYSAGRAAVTDWEVASLTALETQLREEQAEAFMDHCSRTEVGGFGHLGVSIGEIRAAAGLDLETVTMVIPDLAARNLIGLTGYLPASANEGVRASMPTPRSATEHQLNEARLRSGLQAIHLLTGY